MEIANLRKEIHRLASQQYRLRLLQLDPEGFKDRERKRHREYYITHKEQTQKRTTEYRKSHRDWFNAYKRMWYRKNRQRLQT